MDAREPGGDAKVEGLAVGKGRVGWVQSVGAKSEGGIGPRSLLMTGLIRCRGIPPIRRKDGEWMEHPDFLAGGGRRISDSIF